MIHLRTAIATQQVAPNEAHGTPVFVWIILATLARTGGGLHTIWSGGTAGSGTDLTVNTCL